ncbi:MAG TPA: YIP1 family protein [Bauldia sp.]|nr:YIP1 family protein [Bauldia sp.]
MPAVPTAVAPPASGFFARLLRDPRRLRIAWQAMLAMSFAYALVSVFLAGLHGIPWTPFLRIPDDSYYFWASFFYVPVLMLGWVFGAAILHLSARGLGGTGSFEDTLALAGVATALATLSSLVPDLLITGAQITGLADYAAWYASVQGGGFWFVATWTYLTLYLVLFLWFYARVVAAAHGLAGYRLAVATLAGFAAYQGFILIFIR